MYMTTGSRQRTSGQRRMLTPAVRKDDRRTCLAPFLTSEVALDGQQTRPKISTISESLGDGCEIRCAKLENALRRLFVVTRFEFEHFGASLEEPHGVVSASSQLQREIHERV